MKSRKRNKLKLSFRRQSTSSFSPCKKAKANINAEEFQLEELMFVGENLEGTPVQICPGRCLELSSNWLQRLTETDRNYVN